MATYKVVDPNAFDNEAEAIMALRREADRFLSIAQKVWARYIMSYSPTKYVRTFNSLLAMEIEPKIVRVDGDTLGIVVTFKDSLAYHPSVIKGGSKGHAIILISEGWHARKLEAKMGKVHRFTYYEGFGFLGKVMSEFLKSSQRGITAEWITPKNVKSIKRK